MSSRSKKISFRNKGLNFIIAGEDFSRSKNGILRDRAFSRTTGHFSGWRVAAGPVEGARKNLIRREPSRWCRGKSHASRHPAPPRHAPRQPPPPRASPSSHPLLAPRPASASLCGQPRQPPLTLRRDAPRLLAGLRPVPALHQAGHLVKALWDEYFGRFSERQIVWPGHGLDGPLYPIRSKSAASIVHCRWSRDD
ncbi:Hypothetical predicted protein [Olea europaea subsp. europaea]|uniref:Uncharacterized protein n=1 Tax=Olea europaea subsp. europaea TaxID=158383 RepID=A0A8S0UFL6_OLEEU|nr:Hypothetical predicted protein [Olea europaea subsp. europaea]